MIRFCPDSETQKPSVIDHEQCVFVLTSQTTRLKVLKSKFKFGLGEQRHSPTKSIPNAAPPRFPFRAFSQPNKVTSDDVYSDFSLRDVGELTVPKEIIRQVTSIPNKYVYIEQ